MEFFLDSENYMGIVVIVLFRFFSTLSLFFVRFAKTKTDDVSAIFK